MLPVLFLEFMRTRALLRPYWDEWLEADGYPVFEEWIAEVHPEMLETALEKKQVLEELMDLYEADFWHHSITNPDAVIQSQKFASIDDAKYSGNIESDETSFAGLVEMGLRKGKTFKTDESFFGSVQYCYFIESEEQSRATKIKNFLAPNSLEWRYDQHEAELAGDELLLELFSEGRTLNREIIIRRRFGGIPNSWSPGHEHQLPLSLQNYGRFPYKLGAQPEDFAVYEEDPEYAQYLADSIGYLDENGDRVDPYEEYRPHDFVTQDIPEGCWWV